MCAATAFAAAAGGDAGAWLGLGGGARANALAHAFVALADDPSALFYNAAGLDQIPGIAAEFTYHYPYADVGDIAYANAAASYNLSGRGFALGTVGLGVNYFKAGRIPEAGPLGLTGRTFSDAETALTLGWGKALGGDVVAGEEPRYYLGLASRFISSKLYEYQDSGFGLDAGLLFRPLPAVGVGLSFANLVAPNIELKERGDLYAAAARLGAVVRLARAAAVTAEGRMDKDGTGDLAAAAEINIGKGLSGRFGYRYPGAGASAGLGVAVGAYRFDFGWRPNALLGDSFVATFGAAR